MIIVLAKLHHGKAGPLFLSQHLTHSTAVDMSRICKIYSDESHFSRHTLNCSLIRPEDVRGKNSEGGTTLVGWRSRSNLLRRCEAIPLANAYQKRFSQAIINTQCNVDFGQCQLLTRFA